METNIKNTSAPFASPLSSLREITKMFLHYGDMTDSSNLNRILEKVKPDKIYNFSVSTATESNRPPAPKGWSLRAGRLSHRELLKKQLVVFLT